MAASWCKTRLLICRRNPALASRNGPFQKSFICEDVAQQIPNNYSVRQCSQFALRAEKMDGNYRLKDSKPDDENDEEDQNKYREYERKPKFPPAYIEARDRYYTSRAYKAKTYQWEGKASGIDPSIMWPTQTELAKMKAFEKEWCPTLQEMQSELEEERRLMRLQDLKREKLIAANMAKMPQMIKEWQDKLDETKRKEADQQQKRAKLLEEARIKLGYNVDHRSPLFKAMVSEMEAEEKKRKKDLKKKARQAQLGF